MKTQFFYLVFAVLSINLLSAQDKQSISEKEIEIHIDDISISGTLLLPDIEEKVPLVILISGSYPDNRDAEMYGFKPFKKLSSHLANRGIASFRYDDRGVGKSTGKKSYYYEMSELTKDVCAAINELRKLTSIDTTKIGLLGHSGGGIMASMIASKNKDIAFVITMGVPFSNPKLVNVKYREESLIKSGWEKEYIDIALELENRIIDVTISGIGYETLMEDIEYASKADFERLPIEQKKNYKDWEDYYKESWYGAFEPFINKPYLKSWFQSVPTNYLANVKCPFLFLMGEFDGQANISSDGPLIIDALKKSGNNNYTIRQIPNAGHYFVNDWSAQEKTFVPGFLEVISNWIKEQSEFN
jgi:pimeloyl-ACP methyl ester carboxylesterase